MVQGCRRKAKPGFQLRPGRSQSTSIIRRAGFFCRIALSGMDPAGLQSTCNAKRNSLKRAVLASLATRSASSTRLASRSALSNFSLSTCRRAKETSLVLSAKKSADMRKVPTNESQHRAQCAARVERDGLKAVGSNDIQDGEPVPGESFGRRQEYSLRHGGTSVKYFVTPMRPLGHSEVVSVPCRLLWQNWKEVRRHE